MWASITLQILIIELFLFGNSFWTRFTSNIFVMASLLVHGCRRQVPFLFFSSASFSLRGLQVCRSGSVTLLSVQGRWQQQPNSRKVSCSHRGHALQLAELDVEWFAVNLDNLSVLQLIELPPSEKKIN